MLRSAAASAAASTTASTAATPRPPPPTNHPSSNHAPGASLLRLLSPYHAHYEELGSLGRGGFGSVIRARSRLDHRLVAIKRIPFRSKTPPWAPMEDVARTIGRLLREVRALCRMDASPYVTKYHSTWYEPVWSRLSGVMKLGVGVGGVESIVRHERLGRSSDEDGEDDYDETSEEGSLFEESENVLAVRAREQRRFEPSMSMRRRRRQQQQQGGGGGGESSGVTSPREAAVAAMASSLLLQAPSSAIKKGSFFIKQIDSDSKDNDDNDDKEEEEESARDEATDSFGIVFEGGSSTNNNTRIDTTTTHPTSSISTSTTILQGFDQALVPFMLPRDPHETSWPYTLFISMELCDGPTLQEWMHRRGAVPLTHDATREIHLFRQLLLGVYHIHSMGVIHRDIKPVNVFVVRESEIRIGDFGLAVLSEPNGGVKVDRETDDKEEEEKKQQEQNDDETILVTPLHPSSSHHSPPTPHTRGIGTATYSAPEQMQGIGLYGCKVDVYPLGLILIELFTRFGTGMERARQLQDARNGFLPASLWNDFPEVCDLATRLLAPDPGLRLTAEAALRHPLFTVGARGKRRDGVLDAHGATSMTTSSSLSNFRLGNLLEGPSAQSSPPAGSARVSIDVTKQAWTPASTQPLTRDGETARKEEAPRPFVVTSPLPTATPSPAEVSRDDGAMREEQALRDLEHFGIDPGAFANLVEIEIFEEEVEVE